MVCKQLGFSTYGIFSLADWFLNWIINYNVGAIAKTSFYTETIFSHSMFNMSCTGDEDTLFDCVYDEVVSVRSNCYSSEDASVICQGYW